MAGIDWARLRDGIAAGVGEAVRDIRHTYEEVFYGRQVTDTDRSLPAQEHSIHAHERPMKVDVRTDISREVEAPEIAGFEERWAVKPRDKDRERAQEHDLGHDFDR